MSVADQLDDIPHRSIDLRLNGVDDVDANPHWPRLTVWAGLDEDAGPHVVLAISSMWGQAARFAELNTEEARQLARLLLTTADAVDGIVQEK